MRDGVTLARERPRELGLDQAQLYALGLSHVRTLARKVWTDHNVHDPGITTLELLAYALTDLTYRASLPIEDLLAGEGTFSGLSAREVLPNRPLTRRDYRKLMIDVQGVANAWLEPVPVTRFADAATGKILVEDPGRPGVSPVHIRGVYQPRIELEDEALSPEDTRTTREIVLRQLHKHRNLCEDFLPVEIVEPQRFRLCGEVDLHPTADASTVHAAILRRVQSHLTPGVQRYTLDQMLSRRRHDGEPNTPADVFDGPRLNRGFIDDSELDRSTLRESIRLSDVIGLVMDVPGVKAVRQLLIGPEPAAGATAQPIENRWIVPVEAGKQPRLNGARSRIVYYKGHLPVVPTIASVPASVAAPPGEISKDADVPIPAGRSRRVGAYTSVQQHFPEIYGVGEHGLPESASPRRRAQAAQLKAYLLFFDQVMANYCAQLANVAPLFALGPLTTPTHVAQPVGLSPDVLAVYGEPDAAKLAARLSADVESEAQRIARRGRFLDHLIARFAERFHEYVEIMRSAFGATDANLLEDKLAFLKACPALGHDRAAAFDYTLPGSTAAWDSATVSGLEQRVARRLGIGDTRRRDLTTLTPDADASIVESPGANGFGYTLVHRGESKRTLLSSPPDLSTGALARARMLRAFELGQRQATYRLESAESTHSFTIQDDDGTTVGRSPDFATAADRDAAVVELQAYLGRYYNGEGFYVIENILLRPERAADASLRFCVEPGCADCGGDPYSFQIHVVFPAFAGRFNNMDFRRFVEDTVRDEAPAHILPKICWISTEAMTVVQTAYRAWLEGRDGGTDEEREARLRTLVDELSTVKSVYPVQKLIACGGASQDTKFIVGRTALGTKQPHE